MIATDGMRADAYLHGVSEVLVVDKSKYEKIFRKLIGAGDGYLDGKRAVALLSKSGLPQGTLAKVWTLSDRDVDGRLSVKEFCEAMHLIACVRRGMPLPNLPTEAGKEKKTARSHRQSSAARAAPNEARGSTSTNSPRRQSRMATLTEPPHGHASQLADGPCTSTLESQNLQVSDGEVCDYLDLRQTEQREDSVSQGVQAQPEASRLFGKKQSALQTRVEAAELGKQVPGQDDTMHGNVRGTNAVSNRREGVKNRGPVASPCKRRLKLRQLNANNVDAVYAEGTGAIDSLRDVQSWRVLVMGLERLFGKDMARRVPVQARLRRRHTLPMATEGGIARKREFLPGGGRRTSLLGTAYEPAAFFLRQRAERRSAREIDLEKDTAKAAEKWSLQPLEENAERDASGAIGGEDTANRRGNLSVAGLPLLDEDIDVIVNLLRQNHAFRRLDLSRCFLSEGQFVALAQALAWNSRIEELCLQECVFTPAGAAALADVMTMNNHITSIDVRGCKGLNEDGIKVILRASRKKAKLSTFNGMKLAALRAEGSDELDLSGSGLGYVEAVVVADCLRSRPDGLESVNFSNNSLSTEAFTTLMVALRKQSQLRSLDLSHNLVDERTLNGITELLHRNPKLASVNLTDNRISCNEFEHCGLDLMRLLSSNNTITVFNVEENDVSPKMKSIIGEKLAANRAVRKDMTFVDCLHLKYPRIAPRPVLADPRRLHLADADVPFMIQEGIRAVQTTVRTEQATIATLDGGKPGSPYDFFFVQRCNNV